MSTDGWSSETKQIYSGVHYAGLPSSKWYEAGIEDLKAGFRAAKAGT